LSVDVDRLQESTARTLIRAGIEMTDSVPPEGTSLPVPVARPAASRSARFLAQLKRVRGPLVAIASVGAILSGLVGYWTVYENVHNVVVPQSSPAAVIAGTTLATPEPPLMSVAVMPFTPASASADDEGVAERVTQDLTTAMEYRWRYALVVSHSLAAKYKGQSLDPRAVGHDLNVRYLVEGNVRNANGGLVVMARLIETTTGTQVWSVQQAGAPPASNEAAGDLVRELTSQLRYALNAAEQKRVARLPKSGANAMELVLRANALWEQDPSPKGRDAARKLYEEALRHDPGSASALIGLFWTIWRQRIDDPSADREQLLKELDDVSKRAVRADRDDPRVWSLRAYALQVQSQWDGAFEANAEGLRIDPYRPISLEDRAELLIFTGRAEEALPVLDQAIALDPHSPAVPHHLQIQCLGYLSLGRYDSAISACEKALAHEDDWRRRLYLVAAYAQKGDMAKAAMEKAALLKLQPKITIAWLNASQVSNNPNWLQQREVSVLPGLRKAGIPEY
jgi:adenylate cyclase